MDTVKQMPRRMKLIIAEVLDRITPFVQKLHKWFKAGFIGHLILEVVMTVVLIML